MPNTKLRTTFLVIYLVHHLIIWIILQFIDISHLNDEDKKFMATLRPLGVRFMTIWNLFLQTVYLFIALVIEYVPYCTQHREYSTLKLKKFNWYIFSCFIFPWTLFIPTVFWAMIIVDRELIIPKVFDKLFPTWVNYAVHTNILALLIVEIIYMDSKPVKWRSAFIGITIYAIIYNSVLVFTYFNDGIWLYNFFNLLNWLQRGLVLFSSYLTMLLLVYVGLALQNWKFYKLHEIKGL